MWQQNLGASGFRPQAPNPNDWANVAAQWLENKKFYEQWQQQQYQQHMQMMAATHAAQMAQSIDPSVITNPPPPPPEPTILAGVNTNNLSEASVSGMHSGKSMGSEGDLAKLIKSNEGKM